MLKHLSHFYRPHSIAEACALLAARDRKNVALAGGTYLGVVEDQSIEGLVDLKQLPLSYIRKTASGFSIGAMTVVQDIYKSSMLTGPSGALLRKASRTIGSTLLRHSVTIGGNSVKVLPWSDLPPALLALDAVFVVSDGKRSREIPAKTFFQDMPQSILGVGELVTELKVPLHSSKTGVAFFKFAKTKNDYALITVATRLTLDRGEISEARIALNAITKKPLRCTDAEKMLIGQKPSAELFDNAGQACLKGLDLSSDIRATKEYRAEVLPVFVRRCLAEAAEQVV